MKKTIYSLWNVPGKAVKVASCTSSGVYINFAYPQKKARVNSIQNNKIWQKH